MFRQYIHTFRTILKQPQDAVDSFIYSDNSSYQHPFLFCLIGMLPCLILNLFMIDFSFDPAAPRIDGDHEHLQELAIWMEAAKVRASTQYLPLSMILLLIPFMSLPGLFFFREKLDSFYSNIILNSYTVGVSMAAFLILIPFWSIVDIPLTDSNVNVTVPSIVIGGIGLWVYRGYFRITDFIGIIRIMSSWITGYVLFFFVKGFVAGVIGYMLFAITRIYEISGG